MNDVAHKLERETEAAKALLDEFAAAIGDDEELREATIEGETNWHGAVRLVMARVKQLKGFAQGIDTEMEAVKQRKVRFQVQDARLRAALYAAMAAIGQTRPVEFDIGTLSKPKVPDGVVYDDESQVPAGYWKPGKPVLDKDAVRADLEAGKEVPGARLEKNRTTLAIRFT